MTESKQNYGPNSEQLLELYEKMLTIRRVEERLSADFHAGKLPGGVHLYIGQEAVAAGVCAHLGPSDWIASTHRGHGHFIAKGGEPKQMIAEIYGRETGICKGMGGSMHVADFSKGILGANGIVAGGMGLTVGAALAAQLDGEGNVAISFFGDGASNQGVFMESLNIGTLWKLPIVFICENNGFSEFSPAKTVTAGEISDRARAFGIPVSVIDGNDISAVWTAAAAAVDHARAGDGPAFVEAKTYRIHGHLEAEVHFISKPYRDDAEIDEWRKRDPIDRLGNNLQASGICDSGALEEIDTRVMSLVDEAVAFAEAGALPDPAIIQNLMFAPEAAR